MRTALFQRVDHKVGAYRWYRITLWTESGDLFRQPKVIIERGRIGQQGETIERYFDTLSGAKTYFQQKVNQRLQRGYIEVGAIDLSEPECGLCNLLNEVEEKPTFVHSFKHTVLVVNWDQSYLGRSMLILKRHIPDFFRLASSELLATLSEIRQSEAAIRDAFGSDLMNYLFMGNRAGHVHLHLVPRYESDPNFGSSPFLETSRTLAPSLSDSRYRQLAEKIRERIVQ